MASFDKTEGVRVVESKTSSGVTSTTTSTSIRDRSLVQSARLLMLNSPVDLADLQQVLITIVQNIISNPGESKYRSLKFSNKLVQLKIAQRKGGLEYLRGVGFEVVVKDGEKSLQLVAGEHHDDALSASVISHLTQMLGWLNENVAVCLDYAANRTFPAGSFAVVSSSAAGATPCAECIIQIKMPLSSGATVEGGFGRSEPVSAIADFARAFFTAEKADSLLLRNSHDASLLETSGELGARTLEEARLAPRSVLLATLLSDSDRESALQAAKQTVAVEVKQTAVNAEVLRMKKRQEANARTEERERALRSFRDDRDDAKHRVPANGGQENISTSAMQLPDHAIGDGKKSSAE